MKTFDSQHLASCEDRKQHVRHTWSQIGPWSGNIYVQLCPGVTRKQAAVNLLKWREAKP